MSRLLRPAPGLVCSPVGLLERGIRAEVINVTIKPLDSKTILDSVSEPAVLLLRKNTSGLVASARWSLSYWRRIALPQCGKWPLRTPLARAASLRS